MKHADVLNEVILNLQAYDLSHVEETIIRLNARIANLPAEVKVRFEPCSKCGIILTPGRKLAEHARDCTYPDYQESGEAWEQEDEDYARQCADEKWRSNHS